MDSRIPPARRTRADGPAVSAIAAFDSSTASRRGSASTASSPPSSGAAVAVDAIYSATALFDHPLLPPVLDFGSTEIAGRAFIAFQTSEPVAGGGHRTRRGTMTALAELQIAALDCGFAGIHLPLHELKRLREGARLEARHLPVNEFLCEPRRAEGGSGARRSRCRGRGGAVPRAGDPRPRRGASRPAPRWRIGSPPRSTCILEGYVAGDLPIGDADKTMALSALPIPAPASAETRRPAGAGPARPVAAS